MALKLLLGAIPVFKCITVLWRVSDGERDPPFAACLR